MNYLPDSPFTWLAVALLLFWFVGAHNRLMRLRVVALQAFATLDAALVRQFDFVMSSALAGTEGTLPARALVVASSEDILRAALQASARQFTALLSATRLHPLDPGVIAALSTSLHVMLSAWQRLHPEAVTIFDADGTLSQTAPLNDGSPAVALPTPMPWPEPSAAAEIARGQFNLAVAYYNAAVRQFPAVLVAWLCRLTPAAPIV